MTVTRKIIDENFPKRLNEACIKRNVPDYNYGRLTWIKNHLESEYNIIVSIETVRKWSAGEVRPKPAKMKKLADLLKVDEAWLSLGTSEMVPSKEKILRDATKQGEVNLVAGLISLSGGTPSFPESNSEDPSNLIAIIKGKLFNIYVSLGYESEAGIRFVFPANYEKCTAIIGVIKLNHLQYNFLNIDKEFIGKHGEFRGGQVDIIIRKYGAEYGVKGETVNVFKSFEDGFN